MRALVLILAIACSGSPPTAPQPTSSQPPASLVSTSAGAGDVEVARVNGRPVWGSCVTAQSQANAGERGLTRDQALRQCVDFELMAQEAELRALAIDSEVVLATRTALVSELVAHEYEDKYKRPSEFGGMWDKIVEKNLRRFVHPEYRGSAYVRIAVAKTATPAQDNAARVIAEEIAAALGNERGLMPTHIKELAERVVAGRAKLEHAVVPPYLRSGLDKAYADTLWQLGEVGRTSQAVRTQWGWDVILFNELIPDVHPSADELVAMMLPDVKRTYFPLWVNQIAARLGVKIKVDEANVPLLENL